MLDYNLQYSVTYGEGCRKLLSELCDDHGHDPAGDQQVALLQTTTVVSRRFECHALYVKASRSSHQNNVPSHPQPATTAMRPLCGDIACVSCALG